MDVCWNDRRNNIFHDLKVLKKVIKTETFNVDFQNKFIQFGLFFFYFLHAVGFISIFVSIYYIYVI